MADNNADILRGAKAISAFLAGLIDGPPPTKQQVAYWAKTKRIRVGKLGAELIASKTALREDLARAARREIKHCTAA